MSVEPTDLGHGVSVEPTVTYADHAQLAGFIFYHPCKGHGGDLTGSFLNVHDQAKRPRWKVEQLEPLTLSPSVQCTAPGCDHHGFIREGRWVPC